MSIDKNSTGFPEVNLQRKTTQVNMWMIVGVVLFLVGGAAVTYWTSQHTPATEARTSTPAVRAP